MELTDPEEKDTPLLTYYNEMLRKPQASSRPKARCFRSSTTLKTTVSISQPSEVWRCFGA